MTAANQKHTVLIVVSIMLLLLIPATLSLMSVIEPGKLVIESDNPTPLGYTISLGLFLVPCSALAVWFMRKPQLNTQKKAFKITLLLLVPTGIALDVFFGNQFFTFTNHNAVSGITFPAVGGALPVEELIFYISGFATVLLLYIWCDEFWLEKYNIPDYATTAINIHKLVQFHSLSLFIGLGLIGFAVVYKALLSDESGFPWYFIYLVLVALIPSMTLYRCARDYINWRAFSLTCLIIVLISLLWEVTLALPYGWWDFQHENMMGIYVRAWHELPLEEIVVWFSVSFASIIFYESVKIGLSSGKSLKQMMFGR